MSGKTQVGLIGLGAFGQLAARHLAPHVDLRVFDPGVPAAGHGRSATLEEAAAAPVVILAVPVQVIRDACKMIAPYVAEGALVLDVASVKLEPMAIMREVLPAGTRIIGTHPLFGPQSAAEGIAGQSIVLCPEVDEDTPCLEGFLSGRLGLEVHVSDADMHDRTMASVQALTHLVSKVLTDLGLEQAPYSTRSYDLLVEAANLVRSDSEQLFRAIERHNPHAAEVRDRFFAAARALDERLKT